MRGYQASGCRDFNGPRLPNGWLRVEEVRQPALGLCKAWPAGRCDTTGAAAERCAQWRCLVALLHLCCQRPLHTRTALARHPKASCPAAPPKTAHRWPARRSAPCELLGAQWVFGWLLAGRVPRQSGSKACHVAASVFQLCRRPPRRRPASLLPPPGRTSAPRSSTPSGARRSESRPVSQLLGPSARMGRVRQHCRWHRPHTAGSLFPQARAMYRWRAPAAGPCPKPWEA